MKSRGAHKGAKSLARGSLHRELLCEKVWRADVDMKGVDKICKGWSKDCARNNTPD